MVKSKHHHNQSIEGEASTHFGFQTVPEASKEKLVRGVFDAVAPQYDVMNDLMSGGIHRLWKAAMVDWLMPRPGWRLVDVAGGTGDIAFRILDRIDAVRGDVFRQRPTLTRIDWAAVALRTLFPARPATGSAA